MINYLRDLTIKNFLLFFCIAYTFFDITGALVAEFNHTRGGIITDSIQTNNPINLIITVKPLDK